VSILPVSLSRLVPGLGLCLALWVARSSAQNPAPSPIPLEPRGPDPHETVQRVPDRKERIDLVLPAGENWRELSRQTNPDTRVELIELQRTPDEQDRWADHAEVFVFHSSWRTDLGKAQDTFLKALELDCPGATARDWLREDLDAPRRVTVYTCPEAGGSGTRAVVQLLLQGSDNFYAVNIYLSGEAPSEGILVKWVERLKEIRPCVFGGRLVPCPEGLWSGGGTAP
jgi:hypothetical protein